MTAPRRRIWLYVAVDTDPDVLEIAVLGAQDDIAPVVAAIKGAAERWPGFGRVGFAAAGGNVGVLRASLTYEARYDDPIAEGMAMLDEAGISRQIDWTPSGNSRIGMVGTW